MSGPRSTAEAKALLVSAQDTGPTVIFGSGYGNGFQQQPLPVKDANGETVLFVVAVPPRGASEELLMAFSARATTNVRGRCFLCDAASGLDLGGDVLAGAVVGHSTVLHEEDCPAGDDLILAAVRAHWATPRNAPCPCGSGKKFKMCHLNP